MGQNGCHLKELDPKKYCVPCWTPYAKVLPPSLHRLLGQSAKVITQMPQYTPKEKGAQGPFSRNFPKEIVYQIEPGEP
jgi:hypothetical protein